MQRLTIALLLICLINNSNFFAQNWVMDQGIYAICETGNYKSKLKQTIPSTEFRENYDAFISTYPSIKLGYSFTYWGNFGLLNDVSDDVLNNWLILGVDFGIGLTYSQSIMNADPTGNYNEDPIFSFSASNGQTFFNYYQPGNQCSISDYGLNMHFDAGSIFYLGAEIDAGPSRIVFTDNRIQGQEVRSTGWFVSARLQGGLSIPIPFWDYESRVKANVKFYTSIPEFNWSGRFYKLDWFAEDKKLKNFSILDAQGKQGQVYGISLTFLLNNQR